MEHNEVGKRKKQLTANASAVCDAADREEPQSGGKGKKKRGSRGKESKGKSWRVDTTVEDTEEVKLDKPLVERMTTRHMVTKHVPVVMIAVTTHPKNYRRAMHSPRSADWQQAMTGGIELLESNCTWEVVPRPYRQEMLHSKWVFKAKRHADNTLGRYKARLVACGNDQSHGLIIQ